MKHFRTVTKPNYKEISHGVLSTGDDWRIVFYDDRKYYLETRFDNDTGWLTRLCSFYFDDVITYRDMINERGFY